MAMSAQGLTEAKVSNMQSLTTVILARIYGKRIGLTELFYYKSKALLYV